LVVDLKTPALIGQGTRDEFGDRREVLNYHLLPLADILWLEDGDHGLKPRKRILGFSAVDHLAAMTGATLTWAGRPIGSGLAAP